MMPQEALVEARAVTESMMVDSCKITRGSGGWTVDPETGSDVPTGPPVVYEGKCKLASTPQTGEQRDSNQYRFSVESPRLHLPIDAPVRAGDRAEITASDVTPRNVGFEVTLTDLNRGTYRTAQRWNVEAVTR